MYPLDLLLRQQQNALNRDYYRIIVSYLYRDNFDLSYRLSIENSIWHIVTALVISCSNFIVVTKQVILVVSLTDFFDAASWCHTAVSNTESVCHIIRYIPCDFFDYYIFNYEIMPVMMANTFLSFYKVMH